MNRLTAISMLLTLFLISSPVFSHEFWILPSEFSPSVGEVVHLRLRLGEPFRGEPVLRDTRHINTFSVWGPNGEASVFGRDGGDPAGIVRIKSPGPHIVSYRSNWTRIEHEPAAFARYLKEDGLDHIAGGFVHNFPADAHITEVYTRCAKTLLLAGDSAAGTIDRPLGLPFELIADNNTFFSESERLSFLLAYEGKPCVGALVVAVNEKESEHRQTARTNAEGRVEFALDPDCTWLVSAVHIVRAPENLDAHWASYWASLIFVRARNRPKVDVAALNSDASKTDR